MSKMVSMHVEVENPRFWWRTKASEISRLVPIDPDAAGRKPRHADRDEQRWALIASLVAEVGECLAQKAWVPNPARRAAPGDRDSRPRTGIVTIQAPADLTATEEQIVRDWFHAQSVRADPGADQVCNGRHRLWATREHFNDRLVPLLADSLGFANADDITFLADGTQGLRDHFRAVRALTWFDRRDPLNKRYLAALKLAGRGRFPNKV